MDEEVKVEEVAEETEPAEVDGEDGADTGKDSGEEKPKKRAGGKHTYAIEVLAVIVIFYFALSGLGSKFTFKKFAPFKVEADATVSSIDEIVFTGSDAEAKELGDLAESKYSTTFVYEVNGRVYTSELYSKSYPSFEVGEEVTLYLDATDLSSIVSVK